MECLNRLIDIKRLVPPENLYHKIHGCIFKHDDFKMGDWKVFDGMYNALHCKPQYLEQDEGFSKQVTLSPILDFHFGQHEEWFVTVTHPKIACLQWMEGFIVFWQYLHLFGSMLKKMEPSHDDKEPMHYCPLYI